MPGYFETEQEASRRYERETYDAREDNQLGDGAVCCGWCMEWHEQAAMRRHLLVCPERPAALREFLNGRPE